MCQLQTKVKENWSSCCGTTGLVASLQPWGSSSILGLAQWVKDPELLQLQRMSQLQLRSDPWPGNSICCGAAKKEKKKRERILFWQYFDFIYVDKLCVLLVLNENSFWGYIDFDRHLYICSCLESVPILIYTTLFRIFILYCLGAY